VEDRPAPRHAVGRPLRARLPRLAHRVLGHEPRAARRRARSTSTRAARTTSSPTTSARSHRARAPSACPS
jgi:hypothetical protein